LEQEEEKSITIEQCINEFSKEELLDGDEEMYCSNCKSHRPTKKRLTVFSTPDVF
jgi:ubiquitin C-terminal hydrolase